VGHGFPEILAYPVILCFDKQCPKNTLFRLKSNILTPKKFCAGYATASTSTVEEIRDLWAKINILFDATSAAPRKCLKVGFRKVQRVPIILVPKRNQHIL